MKDSPHNEDPTGSWKAWSEKTWVVVVAGLVIPPVGMVLAWRKPSWTTRTKFIAIGLMSVMALSYLNRPTPQSPSVDTESPNADTAAASQQKPPSPGSRRSKRPAPTMPKPSKNANRQEGYVKGWSEGVNLADEHLATLESMAGDEDFLTWYKNHPEERNKIQRIANSLSDELNRESQRLVALFEREVTTGETFSGTDVMTSVQHDIGVAEGKFYGFHMSFPVP